VGIGKWEGRLKPPGKGERTLKSASRLEIGLEIWIKLEKKGLNRF